MNKPFWEESYRTDDVATFRIEPNPTIQEKWSMFEKNGTVLDIGCGEGKNAINVCPAWRANPAGDTPASPRPGGRQSELQGRRW